MRTLSRPSCALTAMIAVAFWSVSAAAQTSSYGNGYPYPTSYYNNQSVQYGLNLPQVPVPSGSDEVRAADGTTCKSSISGNGPTMDFGVLGNQDLYGQIGSGTVYGRVVVPLGERPKRIDCSKLYQLEIERLQHELQLVRMGANGKGAGVTEGSGDWQTKGWTSPQPVSTKPGGVPFVGAVQAARPSGREVQR